MTVRWNERNNWNDVHVTANRYQLAFVFLFTAFAPSTSKSSGTSAVYCSFPPSIRIWLKFAWICGFRYHFTLNKPAGIESIQTHPKTPRENFPFGKSPKKKTLRLTLKYILSQASFCLCATNGRQCKGYTGSHHSLPRPKGFDSKANSLSAIQTIDYRSCWLTRFSQTSLFFVGASLRNLSILFTLIHNSNLFKERISLISFRWTLETLLFALCPTNFWL